MPLLTLNMVYSYPEPKENDSGFNNRYFDENNTSIPCVSVDHTLKVNYRNLVMQKQVEFNNKTLRDEAKKTIRDLLWQFDGEFTEQLTKCRNFSKTVIHVANKVFEKTGNPNPDKIFEQLAAELAVGYVFRAVTEIGEESTYDFLNTLFRHYSLEKKLDSLPNPIKFGSKQIAIDHFVEIWTWTSGKKRYSLRTYILELIGNYLERAGGIIASINSKNESELISGLTGPNLPIGSQLATGMRLYNASCNISY